MNAIVKVFALFCLGKFKVLTMVITQCNKTWALRRDLDSNSNLGFHWLGDFEQIIWPL